MRVIRERARRAGVSSVGDCIRELKKIAANLGGAYEVRDQLRAIENLLDRFGFPKAEMHGILDDEAPKLFVIKQYEAPASWDEKEADGA